MDQAGSWGQRPPVAASPTPCPPGLCEQGANITNSVLGPHHQQESLLTILRLDAQHGEQGRR